MNTKQFTELVKINGDFKSQVEAKATFNLHYKWTNSKVCQTKLAQIQSGSVVAPTAAGSTEDISDEDI